ncbi:VPLPA-CTERM sorting domain-containing protein [Pseudooceanicola sp.]|uniref:VPLPA-CTERM sorting domain-containing protein n=1 Tax=Pseudooceanicola sp. TaxID=1914328 RepID=UPI0035C6D40F
MIAFRAAIAGAVFFAGVQAAGATGVTYSSIYFPDGDVSFADQVVNYSPSAALAGTSGGCIDSSLALGAPDHTSGDCQGYVSLGEGGSITLKFTDNALTTSGDNTPDLHVFEIGSAVESFQVEISTNGSSWIDFGYLDGQPTSIDIDANPFVTAFEKYYFVRLTDNGNSGPHSGVFAGADIDAVGAISSTAPAIPLPATGILLVAGLAGIGALKRRRAA